MVTVEITKTFTTEEIQERWLPNSYINDPYGAIRQIIFEEMIMHTLPLRITLDTGETIEEKPDEI